MVYKFLDKNSSGNGIENKNMTDQQLREELHKPILRKFKKRKVQSPFIDNIWGADLADMQLTSKFNKEICFSLCVIDICSKYGGCLCLSLKDKKGITIIHAYQKILKESNRKLSKTGVDKGSGFYYSSMK